MGNGGSRKQQAKFATFQKLILDVGECSTDIVKSIDNIHLAAEEFICHFEERIGEARSINSGFSNAEIFCQRLMNLYAPAIHLLMAIEGCYEKKKHTIKQVNSSLHSIQTEVERLCKIKLRDLPDFSSDAYISETEESKQLNPHAISERVRAVMSESVSSIEMPTDLNIKVNELETKVLKMEETISKLSLENRERELRLKEVEDSRMHPIFQSNEDRQIEGKVPVFTSTLVQTIHSTNEESEELEKEIKTKLSQKVVALEQELETVNNQLDDLNREKDRFSRDMQERVKLLEKEKQIVQERENEAAEKAKSLEGTNQMLQKESDGLKLELTKLKSKKFLQVQIYSQKHGDLMGYIENELVALLKSKMDNSNTEVNFIKCFNTSRIKTDKPLLNLCIKTSRLGTDVSNALSDIKVKAGMAMLVFHLKDTHALPTQTSDRILTGPEFRDIGGIFDMAFLSEKGIYPCELNDNSITHLIDFIEREFGGNKGENSK